MESLHPGFLITSNPSILLHMAAAVWKLKFQTSGFSNTYLSVSGKKKSERIKQEKKYEEDKTCSESTHTV